jgi:hypothetical protein
VAVQGRWVLSVFIGWRKTSDVHLQIVHKIYPFGAWWGTDPREKAQSDFDVIAANRSEKRIVLGGFFSKQIYGYCKASRARHISALAEK